MWANALQNSGLENFADAFGVNRSVNEGGGAIRPGMHLQAIVPIRGPRGSRTSRFLHRFSSDPPSNPCVPPPQCLAPTLDVLTCAKSVSARARSHCLWSLNCAGLFLRVAPVMGRPACRGCTPASREDRRSSPVDIRVLQKWVLNRS